MCLVELRNIYEKKSPYTTHTCIKAINQKDNDNNQSSMNIIQKNN